MLIISILFVALHTIEASAAIDSGSRGDPPDRPYPTGTVEKQEPWTGVDVSIVGKYATSFGRPPRDPYINTDRGDLLLCLFTLGGTIGGFIIGYNWHKLMKSNTK